MSATDTREQHEIDKELHAFELAQEAKREEERRERRERRLESGMEALSDSERQEPNEPTEVLRKLVDKDDPKKQDWSEFGWSTRDIEEVEAALKVNLNILESNAYNGVEILVASGITPEVFRQRLAEWRANKDQIREDVNQNTNLKYLRLYSPEDIDKYVLMKYLGAKEERIPVEGEDDQVKMHYENIRDDYIQRFVLDKEFSEYLQQEYESNPSNLNELAWNIHYADRADFGINGKFPVIEMRIDKDKNGNVTGKYCMNKANYMRWIRKWINWSQDKSPDEVTNYFADVKLDKQMRPVSLGEIIDNQVRYFTDEDGGFHSDVANQSLLEPWMMMTIKDYDVAYKTVMAGGEKLAEQLGQRYQLSKLTKKTFNKSMLYHLATLSVDYNGNGTESDASLGGAFNTMFLAYYNISDFPELEKVLGKDSSFFKKEGMMNAMKSVIDSKRKQTGTDRLTDFLGKSRLDKITSFYDEHGNLKRDKETLEAFTKEINFIAVQWSDPNWTDVIHTMLKNAVKEMYDFTSTEGNIKLNDGKHYEDNHSLEFSSLIAQTFIRFSGAGARNDIPANGFDSASKWLNTEAYRRKMATEKRGGSAGNPYTIAMFKSMLVDMFQAIRVSEATTTKGVDGAKTKSRKKTAFEVLSELNAATRVNKEKEKELQELRDEVKDSDPSRAEEINRELARLRGRGIHSYKQVAGQLEFGALAMANYAANHVNRAAKLYEQITGAKEISFDKFVHHDVLKGVTFDRAAFQKEVQEDFLKPLRYLFATYGDLNFNMPVRFAVFVKREGDADVREFRTIPLGEALFGHQLLDIPKFWKLDERGKPMKDKETKKRIIDYDKVQADQTTVWKQWALMKLAGDMWAHIDRHSSDSRYGMSHYLEVIEAIERIPAAIETDEYDMAGTRITKGFFTHEQIKWLRAVSKTDTFSLFRRQLLDDLFGESHDRKGSGFGDAFSMIANAVFRGY